MNITELVHRAHETAKSKGFYEGQDPASNETLLAKLALIHSEIGELTEVYRKGQATSPCDKAATQLTCEEEEMADIAIRLFDLAGFRGIDLERAIAHKMAYNVTRPHKHGKLI